MLFGFITAFRMGMPVMATGLGFLFGRNLLSVCGFGILVFLSLRGKGLTIVP